MPDANPLTRVLPEDRLYRKLRPDQWNPATLEVLPAAYIDRHPRLSLYVARIVDPGGPKRILQSFCGFPFARALCPDRTPRPEDLYAAGHAIAVLPARLLFELQLLASPEPDGNEIRADGHLNVVKGESDFAIDFAEASRALTYDEIFGS